MPDTRPEPSSQLILLVEDSIDISSINRKALAMQGYRVLAAAMLSQARDLLAQYSPDLIILDVMLPDGDGLGFCRELHQSSRAPVLFLSALGKKTDIIAGLKAGGDDYLSKPYNLDELLARVESLLRRAAYLPQAVTIGKLMLDITSGQAFISGRDMLLTQKEFALLLLFTQHQDRAVSAGYLYEGVWKLPMAGDDSAVKNAIYRLRKKLVGSGYTINARRGEGYVLERSSE